METKQTHVKICGLRRMEDVEYANQVLPDYVGYVFATSKRQVTPQEAMEFTACLNPAIQAVGVFVDQPIDFIVDLVDKETIELIQLHGSEDEKYISDLREELRKRHLRALIIKAVKVTCEEDIRKGEELDCDFLLLDAWCDPKGVAGGHGKTFDWTLINRVSKPFFLAGGLGINNVKEAIQMVHPYAVDGSSSMEIEGYKDLTKMENFVKAVREQRDWEENHE